MSTWIKELKEKSRKVVESPNYTDSEGRPITYTIRALSQTDIIKAQMSVILPAERANSVLAIKDNTAQRGVESVRYCVEHGVVVPRIEYGEENAVPDDRVHISWISKDEQWLARQVCEFSGMDIESESSVQAIIK